METQTKKIVYCSWGYSMTLIEFYEVVKETAKTVVLRELEQEEVTDGFLSGTTTPTTEYAKDRDGQYKEVRAYKRSFNGEQNYISKKAGFKKFYHDWNGKPKHFNHCD
jgi:hypothetical protein